MTPRSGAGLGGKNLSVTGEAATAAEPAQAVTLSPLAAPKPAKQDSNDPDDQNDAVIETIEPSTGEIIVLAQRKLAVDTTTAVAAEDKVTPLAKPGKRKNAKENAKQRLRTKPAEDETTPDMTATAKSNAGAKSAEVLAANEARKERKAAAKGKARDKAKPAKAGGAGAKAKARR